MRPDARLRTYVILAVSISAVTMVVVFLITMDNSTWSAIARIDPLFLLIALGMAAMKWFVTCVRTNLLIRASRSSLSFWKTAKSVLAGGFVGAVTPYHAGGIPTEIYFLHFYGMKGGDATAIVTTGAAISILLFVAALPPVLLVSASKIQASFGVRTLLVTAFIIAFFFLLLFVYSMKEPAKLGEVLRRKAPKFLKKKPGFDAKVDSFSRGVGDFKKSLGTIMKAKKSLLAAIVALTFVFWASGFFIAPFILWGLGYPDLFWKAMLAQLVVSCILPFVPIPGESGMAETAFAGIFAFFVPMRLVGFVTLAWRFFMFYLTVVILGIFFIIALRDVGVRRYEILATGAAGKPQMTDSR